MQTGLIQNWGVDPLTVGPIYPFAGAEVLMLVLCVLVWLLWIVWQMRFENATYEREAAALRDSDALARVVQRRRP